MNTESQHMVPFTDMRLPDSETAQRTADADAALRAALRDGKQHIRAVMILEDMALESVPRALALHYANAAAAPRGFVVRASGLLPLCTDGRDLTALLLGGAELCSASSRYLLAVPADVTTAELEQRWAKAHDTGQLPVLDALAPHAHVGVYRMFDAASGSDRYYVIVRANDAASALHLIEETQRTRPTLAGLAKSAAYADLRESSQHVRDALARTTADALGVQLAHSGADCTTATHTVVRAEHVHQTQTPAMCNDGTEEYVVYNGATNTSVAHSGALVYQGPIGGYALVRNTHKQTLSSGFSSEAWHTDQLSALSTDAPHHVVGEHGEPALHRNTNDATRAAFARKVRWDGDAALHPLANERRALVTDQMVRETAPPVSDAQKLHVSQMHTVVAALPAHERSVALTIAELAAEARADPDATALPVPFNSDAMRTFTRHFDDLDTDQTVADIMTMATKVPLSPLITQRSLCTEHRVDGAHTHPWYNDTAGARTHECMQGADSAPTRHRSVVMLPTKLIRAVAARVEARGNQ